MVVQRHLRRAIRLRDFVTLALGFQRIDLTLAGWGGPACDYMIDFACVSSTTPTRGNAPRWCTSGIAATEAERNKLAADRASSAPVQGVHRSTITCRTRGRDPVKNVVYMCHVDEQARRNGGAT
eukprot:jgi/Tetstr1/434269/TSEL_023376.t1